MTPHMQRDAATAPAPSLHRSRGADSSLERARPLPLSDEAGRFHVNVGRAIAAPVDVIFDAWTDGAIRKLWLGGGRLRVRGSAPHRLLALVGEDGSTIEVLFFPQGPDQAFVRLEQRGLRGTMGVARAKRFWEEKLTRLKVLLEGV